ncbi:MAG: hypothetical protein U0744_08560 [Gemmataceae bacterium]
MPGSSIASLALCVVAIAYRAISNARFNPNSTPAKNRIALEKKEGFLLRVQENKLVKVGLDLVIGGH